MNPSLIQAIRRRDLALVDWIFGHFTHCVSDVEVVEEAASTGQLEILKFLLEKDKQEEYDAGNANGDGNGVTWGGKDMELAVKNGHSDVVEWLLEHTSNKNRVEDGNLLVVKLLISRRVRMSESRWLVEQNVGGEEPIMLSSKHLDINMWLVESGLECGVSEAFANACGEVHCRSCYINTRGVVLDSNTPKSAMESAPANGHLEVVKWLVEHDIGRHSTSAIHFAALNGHLDVVKYLHEQGFTGCNQITLRMAASGCHLPVLQWFYARSEADPKADLFGVHGRDRIIQWMTSEMADAARNGHLEVVHPANLKWTTFVGGAAGRGHLDVVKWLCTHTTINSAKQAMVYAASGGHLPVVKWLHGNSPQEDVQTEPVVEICLVLKWLHTNRPNEQRSTAGIDNAARGGHLHVLRWLLDHKRCYMENDRPVPMLAKKLALNGNFFDALLFLHYEYKDWNSSSTLLATDGPYNKHVKTWFQKELGNLELSTITLEKYSTFSKSATVLFTMDQPPQGRPSSMLRVPNRYKAHLEKLQQQEAKIQQLEQEKLDQAERLRVLEDSKDAQSVKIDRLQKQLADDDLKAAHSIDLLTKNLQTAQERTARAEQAQRDAEADNMFRHFVADSDDENARPPTVEELQAQVARSVYAEQQSSLRATELEEELLWIKEVAEALSCELQSSKDARNELELELQQLKDEQEAQIQLQLMSVKDGNGKEQWIVWQNLVSALKEQVKSLANDKQKLENASVCCQKAADQCLQRLERDRQNLEEENIRLRAELTGLQQDINVMELQFRMLEEEKLSEMEENLTLRLVQAQEHQTKLTARILEVEKKLTRSAETAVPNEELTVEKNNLLKQLEEERCYSKELLSSNATFKEATQTALQQLKDVEMELRAIDDSHEDLSETVANLARSIISNIKSQEASVESTVASMLVLHLKSKIESQLTQLRARRESLENCSTSRSR
ncbi:putative ankyrin repeat protein [Phytophthora citrophthora]|uniref:Ankyrin repeat protein n=1 Tax=Phytophthora citrophthora TaxID=4793 RepID=A0AAD9LR54_9STRA|nr:putative ankyrin repeat protein [Phytophthora citrophthora]